VIAETRGVTPARSRQSIGLVLGPAAFVARSATFQSALDTLGRIYDHGDAEANIGEAGRS
jgi:hypothetical protein